MAITNKPVLMLVRALTILSGVIGVGASVVMVVLDYLRIMDFTGWALVGPAVFIIVGNVDAALRGDYSSDTGAVGDSFQGDTSAAIESRKVTMQSTTGVYYDPTGHG